MLALTKQSTARAVSALMLVAPAALLAACGDDESTAQPQTSSPAAEAPPPPGENTDGILLAIDAKTGREMWRARPPGGAVSPAAAANAQLFVVATKDCKSAEATLVTYDSASGDEQWRAPVTSGCFSWPDTREDVVVAGGRTVDGLDATTGKSRWSSEYKEDRAILNPIGADRLVLITDYYGYDGRVRALDRQDGQERWSTKLTLSGRLANLGVSDTSFLYLTQASGGQIGAWTLTALDLASGEQRWAANVGGEGTSLVGLATNDDTAFVRFGNYDSQQIQQKEGSNTVEAFDAQTGEEIWRHAESGDPFEVGIAVGDGNVYFRGGDKAAPNSLAALDAKSGSPRWRVDLGAETLQGQSTLAAGSSVVVMVISGQQSGRVIAFDAATGSRLWEAEVPPSKETVHAAVISSGRVYVSIWGDVPAFGN